jgi:hypothetical protein
VLARHEQVRAHVGLGKIISGQNLRLSHEFDPLAVRDGFASKKYSNVARTFGDMKPMARVAVDRHALLNDIAFHVSPQYGLTTKAEAHEAGIEILGLGYSSRQGAKLEPQFFLLCVFASLREIHPGLLRQSRAARFAVKSPLNLVF